MAGLTEEGARVATGIIDSLKTQPATLAMIVISFGLLGYTFYEGHYFNTARQEMLKQFLEQQRETQQLLARCVVPNKTSIPWWLPLAWPEEEQGQKKE